MSDSPDNDPVIISVAAYSEEPVAYEKKYSTHLLDRPGRFASLISPKSRILDVGCGPGRDIQIFAEAGHTPIGIDLNPSFIQMARRHGEVIAGDIRDIGSIFTPLSFDGVWAQASLVHLKKAEVEKLLSDLRDLLKPNGHIYACVRATGETGWLDESDGRRWYTTWPDDSFEEAMTSAGFQIIDVTRGPYVEVWAIKV
ncbi:MAG: class I SAM-dependent methyltransferase [Actinobacteria bacterium]|nr:MAG: class I SAM-dependent methyltransferase [Actinomycetota bacterium]